MQETLHDGQKHHLVMARKYRPQKFSEVIEQPMAVTALKNAVKNNRLGSAYLFFGPRGVGKTTIARILAKVVNCKNLQQDEPCNECDSCLSIINQNSMDVQEIDGASHRGIDNIRELRENVKFPPMLSFKKVYIIDEVHMLTNESFNALLKTLEEPPAHVLFIFATTELNKVPETILSRCQIFNFRKVPLVSIQNYLKDLLKKDSIEADDESLFWIARSGDGSIRDSLSYLEQAITFCDGRLAVEDIKLLLGHTSINLFEEMLQSLLDDKATRKELLNPVFEAYAQGLDMITFIWNFLDFLRNLSHILGGVLDPEFLELPNTQIHYLKEKFNQYDPAKISIIFGSIYALLGKSVALKLRNSYETRVLLEMDLISLKEKLMRPSVSGILQKLNQLSASIGNSDDYSPEYEIQKQFLGTVVDPRALPDLGDQSL